MKYLAKSCLAAITAVCFCSIVAGQEKKITRKELPAAVEKTVAQESVGATITEFARETEHGQTFYEASLMFNGRRREILIDKQGNIVAVEDEVSLDSLPQPVQEALRKAAGTGTIQTIESLTKGGKLVAYEAHVRHGRKMSEIQVGPNGEKLKRPE